MLIQAPPQFRRNRRPAKKAPASGPPAAALNLTGVANISVASGALHADLQFDTTVANPLVNPLGAQPAQWSIRWSGTLYVGTAITKTAYNTLHLDCASGGAQAGAAVISYTANPSDIADTLGRFVPVIVNMPLP